MLTKNPGQEKLNVRHFFLTKNFGQEKNEGEAYFCLMSQLVTKKIPDKKKNEGAAFFLPTKNPGQKT